MGLLSEPGDLSRTPLAAILLEALNVRASGVLEVTHGGGTSRVWFRDGRPVGAAVFQGFRPLGQMLLEAGMIDIDALSKSLQRMAETRRPQGELLVEMGVCSRADVDSVLEAQQAGYFNAVASMEGGTYTFLPDAPVPEWTRSSRLSPLRTIILALEKPQSRSLVDSALEAVAKGGVRLATGYAAVEEGFRWTGIERAWVARLEFPLTRDEALAPAGIPNDQARVILAGLLLLGLAVSAADQPLRTGETVVGLGDATLLEPEEPVAAGRRSDPVEARNRRQRLLQQAMRNMGVGPFSRPAGQGPAAPPSRAPGTGGPPGVNPGSPEAELREALLKIAPRAKERDYFVRLGLSESATRDDVKKAFLTLAKQFHPDRFSAPALADLAESVKDFFTAVNEAYETLSDDRRRAEYLVQGRGGARAAGSEAAKVDFQKGEACLRTRDWSRARGFFEAAVRGDPRADYMAALAYVYVADPNRKDRTKARLLLDGAVKDPTCDRAFYVAGILARDEKDEVKAERLFRQAVQINGKNADALRELRAIEARRADRRG
jgi:tetratricopeptide (TPR) repeat protein